MIDQSRQKVLIIKPGYSETLDSEVSGRVSLGDILRTTAILHLFPSSRFHVTWLVDEAGMPVLRQNPAIDRILKINVFTPFHLVREQFDVVINLEKDPGICAMADSISAWRRYGFRLDNRTGVAGAYEHSEDALSIASDPVVKRRSKRSWLNLLFQMLGETYRGQEIILGHRPSVGRAADIGLNYRVGQKFPLKGWPMERWKQVERLLAPAFRISWQPQQDNVEQIEDYIDWIASCGLLITNDSLGLHIALALGVPGVAVFGPTCPNDIDDHPNLRKIWAAPAQDCVSCDSITCRKGAPCMPTIDAGEVAEAAVELFRAFGGTPIGPR